MLKKLGRSGGPEEDRTPDLFIAKGAAIRRINDLRRRNNVENSPKTGGECTGRAQSLAGLIRSASNGLPCNHYTEIAP